MIKKRWKKILAASLIVGNLFCLPIADAEFKTYTAMGVDYGNELESQDIVKLRARDKAIKNAVKQAGVYLKSYSRSINSELTDDEITAITSNTYEIVGEVKYNRVAKQVTDQIILVMWEATVDVKVDDSEIKNWYKRDSDERSKIISQTRESNEAAADNERKVEDLRKRANTVTDDAGRAQLKKDFEQADNEFLYNQKIEEGTRASYRGDLDEAAKFYTEAIELNPNNPKAYVARGSTYTGTVSVLKHKIEDSPRFKRVKSHGNSAETYYRLALEDFGKAIELNPNDAMNYAYRGYAHYTFGKYPQALADYDRALKIDSACLWVYMVRSMYYNHIKKDTKLAMADLNKAIELNPDKAGGYSMRSLLYKNAKQYQLALADINKTIELEPNEGHHYYSRGGLYLELGDYNRALEDFNKCLELDPEFYVVRLGMVKAHEKLGRYDLAIEDYNQIIKDSPDTAIWYYRRGECYEKLGDKAKAKADFDKAKALGFSV
ncbi:MAG: tetratricopeptide repeat protein [Quinella sp. 3Q1]|nr:tetratricopeptide repeat protein [Quinella sp. 3Q1]MBR6886881.1 tetratricopeptide repeat protein [Selenomonadaceae bacterium]